MLIFALVVALCVGFLATLPTYPYSREWGYAPSGVCGALLAAFVILLILGVF